MCNCPGEQELLHPVSWDFDKEIVEEYSQGHWEPETIWYYQYSEGKPDRFELYRQKSGKVSEVILLEREKL